MIPPRDFNGKRRISEANAITVLEIEALEDNVALKELDLSSNEVLATDWAWAVWVGLAEDLCEGWTSID